MKEAIIERPRVTFALLAYNQQNVVCNAILGALAQTYEPLEIILSDDCSSDKTFEIMKRMAAEYKGHHKLIIRQTEHNLGIIEHLNEIGQISSGSLIVLAAGDDISYPNRTQEIVDVFKKNKNATAVFSNFDVLGGNMSFSDNSFGGSVEVSLEEIAYGCGGVGRGATYAYNQKCFSWPRRMSPTLFSEDRILPLRAALMGQVYKLNKSLVSYREAEGGLSAVLHTKKILAADNYLHISNLMEEISIAKSQKAISELQRLKIVSLVNSRRIITWMLKQDSYLGSSIVREVGVFANRIFRYLVVKKGV